MWIIRGMQAVRPAITWFKDNGMQANPDKFQLMVISSKTVEDIAINLGEQRVVRSEKCVKVLGVWIDCKLSFTEHLSQLCKKASRQLNALSRISRFLDTSSKVIIYNSFIRSNFEYCPLVWHFCGKTNNNKLEKINERALRILYKDYESTYRDLLQYGNTSSILESRNRNITLEVLKCIKGISPPCLRALFELKQFSYSFRNSVKLVQPMKKTSTYGLRSLSYLGAKLWNDLPFYVCDIENVDVNQFRNILKLRQYPDVENPLYHYCV